ncbi:hypothetical protein [Chthonobacter albigriseus]|uniref:hypothetical protein n=1 Tax=Chthonobacter albigriseus TaxID=1683161 RepID=UPI0015EF7BFA|nr:hypothetical protein [Chthonobacter albigriseus]
MSKLVVPALAVIALLAVPASAQDPRPDPAPDDNFSLAPAEGEHLKIDRRTGRVSLCKAEAGVWRCSLVPDDREAYEEEVAALRADKERLEARVADLEAQARQPDRSSRLFGPEEEKQLDEFLDFSGHAMRRFFDMVDELKRDLETRDKT